MGTGALVQLLKFTRAIPPLVTVPVAAPLFGYGVMLRLEIPTSLRYPSADDPGPPNQSARVYALPAMSHCSGLP